MKTRYATWAAAFLAFATIHAPAVTLYVDLNSTNPMPPYASWSTAATNIQDAIDASTNGNLILVTNGVYQTGGRVVYGSLTNRVAVTVPLTLRSVNGPAATIIQGYQVPGITNGDSAIRCIYLTNGVVLSGFTVSGGATRAIVNDVRESSGGGIWCESTNAFITNCVITGNSAFSCGGGTYAGTLINCRITTNSIISDSWVSCGGGTYAGRLVNCVIAGNSIVSSIPNTFRQVYGGGACNGVLDNCKLIGNSAYADGVSFGGGTCSNILNGCVLFSNSVSCGNDSAYNCYGGGAAFATMSNCTISNNVASPNTLPPISYGGGAYSSVLSNSTLMANKAATGGGAESSTLTKCILVANKAAGVAGGADGSTLDNCLLFANTAYAAGGGAMDTTLVNCTVVSNGVTADSPGEYQYFGGGGVYGCSVINSIVYYNYCLLPITNYPDFNWPSIGSGFWGNSCTTPLPAGIGNITNVPQFIDLAGGNFRLQTNSPCINTGDTGYIYTSGNVDGDLDGRPRIVGGTVDMGAYEFQGPGMGEFIGWLQQNGLPTDGSVDYADLDGTGFSVYQDWIAGLNPTNALSVLAMLPPMPTNNPMGLVVSWESVSNRTYFLQSCTSLVAQPAFSTIQSNIVGQPDMTSFMDTNAVGNGPFFYRVGVQH